MRLITTVFLPEFLDKRRLLPSYWAKFADFDSGAKEDHDITSTNRERMSHHTEVLLKTAKFAVIRHIDRSPAGVETVCDIFQRFDAAPLIFLVHVERVCLIRNYRVAVGPISNPS